MSEYTNIEQELITATSFTPEKKYRKRQDYLAALLRAVCDDLSDSEFDKLSDDAADWSSRAVKAYKEGKELPDFGGNGSDHDTPAAELDGDDEALSAEMDESGESSTPVADEEADEQPQKEKKKRGRKPKAKVAKAKKEPKERKPTRGTNKWGVANNTKSDLVCRMLAQEGGTTMRDIIEATGQAHYNLVNRLARHGHTILKDGLNLKLVAKE